MYFKNRQIITINSPNRYQAMEWCFANLSYNDWMCWVEDGKHYFKFFSDSVYAEFSLRWIEY